MISDEEINKTIAEFMGWNVNSWDEYNKELYGFWDDPQDEDVLTDCSYTSSLDALVPVVEKLKSSKFKFSIDFYMIEGHRATTWNYSGYEKMSELFDESPARALSLAVYKVIKERE